ncbi:MAG: helix-turn-helix domain-containing protein [Pseudomonadota bacterium]
MDRAGDDSDQDAEMTEQEFDWTDEASTFGDRLALARQYQQMDQATLARRIGVKVETVKNWEYDRSEPRANRLQMLSGLLNVSIIWLMTGEGDGAPTPEELTTTDAATDTRALLLELRELRIAQSRLADRTGRIEKKLRALLGSG